MNLKANNYKEEIERVEEELQSNVKTGLNCRPISLLNCILRVFTSIISARIQHWIDEKGILGEEQFGFRKGRGCREAIFTLQAAISINLVGR